MRKFFKYTGLIALGWIAHMFIEAFVVTNVLAMFGLSIPTIV